MGNALVATKIFVARTHEASQRMFQGRHTASHLGILICDHCSTHVDAQSHNDASPEAMSIEQNPIERFYTSAGCLDVTYLAPEDYITVDVLQYALTEAGLQIQAGDTVLLYTGTYERFYPDPAYLTQYTGLDEAATEWLVQQGVVNIGIDSRSVDHSNEVTGEGTFPVHRVLAKHNVLNTENLANLDKFAGKRFTYIGLPLRIRDGTGSPIRAIAVLP